MGGHASLHRTTTSHTASVMRFPICSPGYTGKAVLAVSVLQAVLLFTYAQNALFTDADWESMGALSGPNGPVAARLWDSSSGDFYLAGEFTAVGDTLAYNVARWRDGVWSPLGTGAGAVSKLFLLNGKLYARGDFSEVGGSHMGSIAQWTESRWRVLGTESDTGLEPFIIGSHLYAFGEFANGEAECGGLARWDGQSWTCVGPEFGDLKKRFELGDQVYWSGRFRNDDGPAESFVATWDGADQWSLLGTGLGDRFGGVKELLSLNGDLFAVGGWDGIDPELLRDYLVRFRLGRGGLGEHASKGAINVSAQDLNIDNLIVSIYDENANKIASVLGPEMLVRPELTLLREVLGGDQWSSTDQLGWFPGEKEAVVDAAIYVGTSFSRIRRWNGSSWSSLDEGLGAIGPLWQLFLMSGKLHAIGRRTADSSLRWGFGRVARWSDWGWTLLSPQGHSKWVSYMIDWKVFQGELFLIGMPPQPQDGNIFYHSVKWDGHRWGFLGTHRITDQTLEVINDELYLIDSGLTNPKRWDGKDWVPWEVSIDGPVHAVLVHRDILYVGGEFVTVDGQSAFRVAKWDGVVWSSLGSGTDGPVYEFRESGNRVYALGTFGSAGDVEAAHVAMWDGIQWATIEGAPVHDAGLGYVGGVLIDFREKQMPRWNGMRWDSNDPEPASGWPSEGSNGAVHSMVVMDGNLFVSGEFDHAGGIQVNGIARWDGRSWHPLGNGFSNHGKVDLAVLGDDLYAGGEFVISGQGGTFHNLARWDGEEWWPLISELENPKLIVNALAVAESELFAGGWFENLGNQPASGVVRWNGAQWSAPGAGRPGSPQMESPVRRLAVARNGVYAKLVSGAVWRWDGRKWSEAFAGDPWVEPFGVDNDLYGTISTIKDQRVGSAGFAKWESDEWRFLGAEFESSPAVIPMQSVATAQNVRGTIYVSGQFQQAGSLEASGLAMWNGCRWTPLGSGIGLSEERENQRVVALSELGDYLYVGGDFDGAGGKVSPFIARVALIQPEVVGLAVTANLDVQVDFRPGVATDRYVLEQSADLMPGSWHLVASAEARTVGELMRLVVPKSVASTLFYRVVPQPPVYFAENFEGGGAGWEALTLTGNVDWELGKPMASDLTEGHSGERVYGTDLDASLTPGAAASLRSPVIDLAEVDCSALRLRFWYFVDTTVGRGGVRLRILGGDGESLLHENDDLFWGTSEGWTEYSELLPDVAQRQKIRLEWLLLTDGEQLDGDGFFLDDVTVD